MRNLILLAALAALAIAAQACAKKDEASQKQRFINPQFANIP